MKNDNDMFAEGMGRLLAGLTPRGYYYSRTDSPTETLAYVHYSDPNFEYPGSVVYGTEQKGLTWIDSWDIDNRDGEEVFAQVKASLGLDSTARLTAQMAEAYLRIVLKKPNLRLVCVKGYSDPANGYGHYVYGFKE